MEITKQLISYPDTKSKLPKLGSHLGANIETIFIFLIEEQLGGKPIVMVALSTI